MSKLAKEIVLIFPIISVLFKKKYKNFQKKQENFWKFQTK